MVPLVGGEWAEVKTLAVGQVRTVGEGQFHTSELSYFSRLTDAQSFGRLASLELHRRGTERAAVVCAVNDGAEWIAKFVSWHCPKAIQILDFPHAAEHVAEAARATYGEGTQRTANWLGAQLHELRHGDPAQVLAALRALPVEQAAVPSTAGDSNHAPLLVCRPAPADLRNARASRRAGPGDRELLLLGQSLRWA